MTILVNIFVKTIKTKSNISFAIANIQRKVKQHKRKQENTLNGVQEKGGNNMENMTDENEYIEFTEITLLKMLRKKFPFTFCRLSPDNIRWECKKGVSIELRFQRCMTFDELKTLEEMLGLGFCISFNFNQGLGSCK